MKRFAVIGLGNFGFFAAKALFEDDNEVIAIDADQTRVQAVDPCCSEAVVLDATDKEGLKALGLEEMDAVADFLIKDSDILIMLGKTKDIRRIKALA